MRDGIEIAPGCEVEFSPDAEPEIIWNHIDGPMLCLRNGHVHWLTLWERFRCYVELDNAFTLEKKLAPEFVERWLIQANKHWLKERLESGAS